MKVFLSVILFIASFCCLAQKEDPTIWQTSVSKSQVAKGEVIELIFTATIQDGWYMYSSDFDKDLGPQVASFAFSENESFELVGSIKPVGAKSKTDNEIWMGTYTYFSKKAEFRQKVKILTDNPAIKVKLNGQACTDESGKCVPVIKQFTFNDIQVISIVASPEENPTKDAGSTEKIPDKNHRNPDNKPKKTSASTLEGLKKEKSKLMKTNKKGEDQTVVELKKFVKKYGN